MHRFKPEKRWSRIVGITQMWMSGYARMLGYRYPYTHMHVDAANRVCLGDFLERDKRVESKVLLLMGSSAFRAEELPVEVKERIDEAIRLGRTIIVGEAYGACRLFQDYLNAKGYRDVVVGHAVRLRYNAGNWRDVQYGKNLKERERMMIENCDSAIVIWMNNSGVIAGNLERLKRLGKPTYLYECSSETGFVKAGELDPDRTYDPFHFMKEHYRRRR